MLELSFHKKMEGHDPLYTASKVVPYIYLHIFSPDEGKVCII